MAIRKLELASPSLLVTQEMLNTAKDNKAIGTIRMDPHDFLALTVPNSSVKEWIAQEAENTKSLEEYVSFTKAGKNRLMPFLDVYRETGKVYGHEGRHRAAALIAAGGTQMEVAITLVDKKGYKLYYEHPYPDDRERWLIKRYLSEADIPNPFLGEFRTVTKFWSPRTFKPFYDTKS